MNEQQQPEEPNQEQNNQQAPDFSDQPLTRLIEPEAEKMGAFRRIISIFTSPGELMTNIKTHPAILVPFFVSVIIGLFSIPLVLQTTDLMNQQLSIISIERYGFDLMALANPIDEYGIAELANNVEITILVGVVSSILFGPLIACLIYSIGFWILSKIVKGSATFGQLFSMCMHTYVISITASLVVSSLMALTGNYIDMTSLAAVIIPEGNISMVSFNILSTISIFSLWVTILYYIGLKILNDISSVKAGIIAFIAFAAGSAVQVLIFMSTFIIWDMAMAGGI